jgi:alpha-D-ribose 1-methylphosphonate 5-triphosphate synthase subunit PhnI
VDFQAELELVRRMRAEYDDRADAVSDEMREAAE